MYLRAIVSAFRRLRVPVNAQSVGISIFRQRSLPLPRNLVSLDRASRVCKQPAAILRAARQLSRGEQVPSDFADELKRAAR